MDVFFPRSSKIKQKFDVPSSRIETQEYKSSLTSSRVTPYIVSAEHVAGFLSFALRVETDGRILTYSGDADWCDELAQAAYEADLFVCEAYFYEKEIRYHMNFKVWKNTYRKSAPNDLFSHI